MIFGQHENGKSEQKKIEKIKIINKSCILMA